MTNTLPDPTNQLPESPSAPSAIQHLPTRIPLKQREALQREAIKAVVIFVGFYVLSLLIIALLAFTPFFMFDSVRVFSPYITLVCYGLALVILVAIIPRRDRFTPPGPRLEPD